MYTTYEAVESAAKREHAATAQWERPVIGEWTNISYTHPVLASTFQNYYRVIMIFNDDIAKSIFTDGMFFQYDAIIKQLNASKNLSNKKVTYIFYPVAQITIFSGAQLSNIIQTYVFY